MQHDGRCDELVSIIVPAYNSEKYIHGSLKSALMQSYPGIEVVVIDDGSIDDTANVVSDMMKFDPRIKCVSTDNFGVSSARNRGLQEAQGNYCIFLDSDDILPSDAIEVMVDHAKKADADLVIGGIRFTKIGRDGVSKKTQDHSMDCFVSCESNEIEQHFYSMIEENYIQSSCSKLYKLESLRHFNILFDETLNSFEDMSFVLSCMTKLKRICVIPHICYEYCLRMDESNSRRQKADMDEQMLNVASRVDDFCSDAKVDPALFDSLRLHLFVNSINSIFGLYDLKTAAIRIGDLCEAPAFRRLFEASLSLRSNCYSKMVLRLCTVKAWPAVCLIARFRNSIRGITGQPVI